VLAAVQNNGYAVRHASVKLKNDPFVKALASRDVKLARECLENLMYLRPTIPSEHEELVDKIVEIAKYFPELEEEAQELSAAVDNPRSANGGYSDAHKRDRDEFEKDLNCDRNAIREGHKLRPQ